MHADCPARRAPRTRNAMSGEKWNIRQWSMRRVFRWVGIIMLAIVVLMAVFGAYGLRNTVSMRVFVIYWTVFFILMMTVIVLAMFDALATMAKFKKEHEKLRKAIRTLLQEDDDYNSSAKLN